MAFFKNKFFYTANPPFAKLKEARWLAPKNPTIPKLLDIKLRARAKNLKIYKRLRTASRKETPKKAKLFLKFKAHKNKPKRYHFKKQQGFASLLLLLFCSLIITGIAGISLLSMGIKNITRAQSLCIKINMEGQKQAGRLLEQILSLNSSVKLAHKTAQGLRLSIAAATASGWLPLIPPLKKKLNFVKQTQSALKARQDMLMAKSRFGLRQNVRKLKWQFKKINVARVSMENPFKKALAIKKQKLGEKAYIYKPQPDFINRQSRRFFWRFRPFAPFEKSLLKIFNISKQLTKGSCVASLKKQGGRWVSALYH